MFFYLKERVLCGDFGVLFEITPDIFKRVFTLFDVEDEVKDFTKVIHDFVIKDAIYRKLGAVKDGEYAPYFQLFYFRVFSLLEEEK